MRQNQLICFDYAIKYLLEVKKKYDIVEDFISALFKTQGYGSVKIVAVLETESNWEYELTNRSLANLIVEDDEKHKYIIKIERPLQRFHIHTDKFNTSHVIVNNLAEGADFTRIVKVFHISLLYFPLGIDAIHHSQTAIKDIKTKKSLTVHIENRNTGVVVKATGIVPEYFYISIPLYNDRFEQEIDDCLYVMKHNVVPETFNSPYMQKVDAQLRYINMTKGEIDDYFYYGKQLCSARDRLQAVSDEAKKKGLQIGIEKGEKKKAIAMAIEMIKENLPFEVIQRISQLSISQIEKLKQEN